MIQTAHRQRTAGLLTVGLGDMQVSADPETTLITYALGSCLGVALYDPVARVGGMLHAMLPRSELDPAKAHARPSMFVDTGIPALFRACYALGARKDRLVVKVAGAGTITTGADDHFEIGKRNLLMARQLFWKNNVLIHAQDTGGDASRTMSLRLGSGDVVIRSNSGSTQL
jgi:chemotaxis protein CheD